jgi:hypothetical protein
MIRTCLSWIQLHPYGAILRYLLNTANSFLCSSTNYFENQLLPNDLIIVWNHRDDENDKCNIKMVQERQGDAHNIVEIKSNAEFQSLTTSPTQGPRPLQLHIDVEDAYEFGFRCSTYAWK